MYKDHEVSGKHLICDLREIQNKELLNSLAQMKTLLDSICEKYDFHILHKTEHAFTPQGFTILYMLAESHISIHTFPEKEYLALDIYTCRLYPDNSVYEEIHEWLVSSLQAKREIPLILDRYF